MIAIYPSHYHDRFGEEITAIQNDGKILRMSIRGVEFTGSMFDDFEPNTTDELLLASFPLNHRCLCSCSIDVKMPLSVVSYGKTVECVLNVQIELGGPKSNGGID